MKPVALAGAGIAGVLGAVVWAVVACTTGFEIGYLAWGVGALVGFAAYALGGRGQVAGLSCAAIALGAILLGKTFAIQHLLGESMLDQAYTFLLPQAEAYVGLESERDIPRFMVEHEYTAATDPSSVPNEEVALFKAMTAPVLDDLGTHRPSLEEWKERPLVQEYFGAAPTDGMVMEILWASLGPIDLIFALLGIGTAYRVCMRDGGSPENPA
jgi:hypothetical protein